MLEHWQVTTIMGSGTTMRNNSPSLCFPCASAVAGKRIALPPPACIRWLSCDIYQKWNAWHCANKIAKIFRSRTFPTILNSIWKGKHPPVNLDGIFIYCVQYEFSNALHFALHSHSRSRWYIVLCQFAYCITCICLCANRSCIKIDDLWNCFSSLI